MSASATRRVSGNVAARGVLGSKVSPVTRTPGQRVEAALAGLNPAQGVTASFGRAPFDPDQLPYASPWAQTELTRILWSDVFGTDAVQVNTRLAALRIPAIARGVNLVKSTIARFPFVAANASERVQTPRWCYSAGGGLSWQLRNAWTVDDLIFYGWSAWWRELDGDELVSVSRIPWDEWEITDDNTVEVQGRPASAEQVILFPGLHEGILNFGKEALSDTRSLYAIVRDRLLNPVPQVDLHQTGGDALTDTEIDALIARWAAARQGKNAGVSYTSEHIQANFPGQGDAQLMIEARNAAAVDMARLLGVHAGMIDATAPKASLNYETATGRNDEFVDFDLAVYMTPITARLSLDDVTAPGDHIAFDLSDFTAPAPSPTGPGLED